MKLKLGIERGLGTDVNKRSWALLHKLERSELLAVGPQLRHPDDSVEGQLCKRP